MPLRSVEAATRDDAIAAAREQFGPQARVVGVRRVRSGGVLGFFATERYVAEVAEVAEVAPGPGRPPVPLRAGESNDDLGPSPLATAAPATAAPSTRAGTGAPARNGAAVYATEAVRPAEPQPTTEDRLPRTPRPATQAAARSLGWTADAASSRWADDQRVDELAGLLSTGGSDVAEPFPAPVRAFPRTGDVQKVTFANASWTTTHHDDDEQLTVERPESAAPSPFTAALARMVAGDAHVRRAVEDAVETPDRPPAGGLPRDRSERRPIRSAPKRPAGTAVWPPAARQEEETVGEQVVAPPSMPPTQPVPIEVPTWAAEPDVGSTPDATRQEAIAEVLRNALAQGHSDEALAGILRQVLDGASPSTARTQPELPVLPGRPHDVVAAPGVRPEVAARTAPVEPSAEEPVAAEPVAAEPVAAEPHVTVEPVLRWTAADAPVQVPVQPDPLPAFDIWGLPAAAPLWGEPQVGATPATDTPASDTPAPEDATTDTPAPETPASDTPSPDHATDATDATDATAGTGAAEAGAAERAEDTDVASAPVSSSVEEFAPVLARTASDPAPFGLSMTSPDATSVMPPLSLLPPLPSSRGRGRPPVPPIASRSSVQAPRPAPGSAPTARSGGGGPAAESAPGPATTALATVTRLPVAPLFAGPEPAVAPEPSERDVASVQSDADPHEPADDPIALASTAPAEPAPVEPSVEARVEADPGTHGTIAATHAPTAAERPDDVVGRLVALGVPARLLGESFRADVDRHGVYASLTRALGLRLPRAPQLPSGAGEVLFVVGPGVETLRAARSLAASLCLDPDRVQWAGRGDLAGLAPEAGRMTTLEAAIARRQDAAGAGTVTIVAVDAPMRTDAYWMAQMLAIWSPVAVWAVVEATRKPEDLEPWLDGLARVDALIVTDTDLSADPAAVLHRVAAPVAVLDGVRATPHRWASVLCERLEGAPE